MKEALHAWLIQPKKKKNFLSPGIYAVVERCRGRVERGEKCSQDERHCAVSVLLLRTLYNFSRFYLNDSCTQTFLQKRHDFKLLPLCK